MTQSTSEESYIIWQPDVQPDALPGEPALLIEAYSDVICISQDGDGININYETVDELCRLLRKLKRERKT